MATSSVPTAPQRRAQREGKTQVTRKDLGVGWLIVIMLVSVFAGFIGSLLSRSYPATWPFARNVLITDTNTPEVVFVQGSQDDNITEVIDILQQHQRNTIVSLFPADETTFTPDRELGKGVIISADGWIATLTQRIPEFTVLTVVLPDGKTYQTDDMVHDTYSGVTYVSIDEQQLPVVDFRTTPMELGQPVIAYSGSIESGDRINTAHVENLQFNDDPTFSTLQNNLVFLIDQDLREQYVGAPVFDDHGALTGLYLGDHQVLPVSVISDGIYSLFNEGDIVRHTLSIEYDPLYRGVFHTTSLTGNSEVVADEQIIDIVDTNSIGVRVVTLVESVPGLQIGDTITKVDDIELDDDNDFAAELSAKQIGSAVSLTVQRDEKTVEVELTVE